MDINERIMKKERAFPKQRKGQSNYSFLHDLEIYERSMVSLGEFDLARKAKAKTNSLLGY